MEDTGKPRIFSVRIPNIGAEIRTWASYIWSRVRTSLSWCLVRWKVDFFSVEATRVLYFGVDCTDSDPYVLVGEMQSHEKCLFHPLVMTLPFVLASVLLMHRQPCETASSCYTQFGSVSILPSTAKFHLSPCLLSMRLASQREIIDIHSYIPCIVVVTVARSGKLFHSRWMKLYLGCGRLGSDVV
jgi:hypothetical protein